MKKLYFNLLAFFARNYLKKTNAKIIGITGSVGKTSSRMIIAKTLQDSLPNKKIYSSPENFNSEIGLVFSIFEIEKFSPNIFDFIKTFLICFFKSFFTKTKNDIFVIEYGIDHPGDMDHLLKITVPDYAIFTKLDLVHSVFFKTAEDVGAEKFKLIQSAKEKVFLNFEDEYSAKRFRQFVNAKFYNDKELEINFDKTAENKVFSKIKFDGKAIKTNLFGRESLSYFELGLEIAKEFGGKVLESYEFELIPGRFTIINSKSGNIFIDSSYNSAPESMKMMIKNTFVLQEKVFPDYKVGLLLGDMRELGDLTEKKHLELVPFIKKASEIVTVGPNMKKIIGGNIKTSKNFLSARSAGKYIKENILNEGKWIFLFKGSQNTIFTEEALRIVLGEESENYNFVRSSDFWLEKKSKMLDEIEKEELFSNL